MWNAYRQRLLPTQLFIAAVCLVLFFWLKWPIGNVLFTLVVMQVFAVTGAAWGQRLKRKIEEREMRFKR